MRSALSYRAVKRAIDLAAALVGLALLALPMLAVALLIRLDSPGSPLFRQTRIGRHGMPFGILKFRTMAVGGGRGCGFSPGDRRGITRLGHILRAAKVDELPQLFNIVKGDMSLVGPRPEVPDYCALHRPEDLAVMLSVRPGLTDFASLRFVDEEGLLAGQADPRDYYVRVIMRQKARYSRFYVKKCGLSADLWLLAATVARLLPALRGGMVRSTAPVRPDQSWRSRARRIFSSTGI